LLLAVLLTAVASVCSALEPNRIAQDDFLVRAVFAEGRLWLLTYKGELSFTREQEMLRVIEPLPARALDLCVVGGSAAVLTGAVGDDLAWSLYRHKASAWTLESTIRREADEFIALNCTADEITLLTTRRLITVAPTGVSAVAVSGKLGNGGVAASYATRDQLLLGFNAGEWGGGMASVDRRTGTATLIQRSAGGGLCAGPLNTDCDPVNGIVPDPWKSGCVIAAIGLMHGEGHGRLVTVCGSQVERLYYKPCEKQYSNGVDGEGEPFCTIGFFGLAKAGEALWAVGDDGLYRLEQQGPVRLESSPKFKDIGGVRVSFDVPGLVLVLASVNSRMTLNGQTPWLVPR
jgi:hypothetical protein